MMRFGEIEFPARLVIFDKDGTLIRFGTLWRTWFARMMEVVHAQVRPTPEFRLGLAATLGYEPDDEEWDPAGPLTLASTAEVSLLVAGEIYHYLGKTWPEALAIVGEGERRARELLLTETLEPVADVRDLFLRLKGAGLAIAIATTDTRQPTEAALAQLGVTELVDASVCGDDGLPLKPAPAMALALCQRLGIPPHETAMVGDTVADLEMARQAGLGLCVGVTSGANGADLLAPLADCVLGSIAEIEVLSMAEGVS